jgi:hypothetical protein
VRIAVTFVAAAVGESEVGHRLSPGEALDPGIGQIAKPDGLIAHAA